MRRRGQRLVEISRPRLAGAKAAPSLYVRLARTPPPSGKCRSDEDWTAHRPWPLSHRNRRLDGRMVLIPHEREVVVDEVEDGPDARVELHPRQRIRLACELWVSA